MPLQVGRRLSLDWVQMPLLRQQPWRLCHWTLLDDDQLHQRLDGIRRVDRPPDVVLLLLLLCETYDSSILFF